MIDWIASWRRVNLDDDHDNVRELDPNASAVAIDPGKHGAAIFSKPAPDRSAGALREDLVVALGGERVGDSLAVFTASTRPTVIVVESQYVGGSSFMGPEIALRAGLVVGVIVAQCQACGYAPHVVHVAPQTWQGHGGVPHHASRKERKKIALANAADFIAALGDNPASASTVRLAADREGVADAFGILQWWLGGPRLRVRRSTR